MDGKIVTKLVCWNCESAQKIRVGGISFELFRPCDSWNDQGICDYKPIKNPNANCGKCINWDNFAGCELGVAFNSPKCIFEPIVKAEELAYCHNSLFCPFIGGTRCNVDYKLENDDICPDCPIEWKKQRIGCNVKRPKNQT